MSDYGESLDKATIDWLNKHAEIWCPTCGNAVAPSRWEQHSDWHARERRETVATVAEVEAWLRRQLA